MIPIYKPYLNGRERTYVNECLDSTWISSKGKFIERFEHSFAEFIGAKYVTTVSNGTVAIHLALEALGIGPGDEVIVPTLTYVASVNTIFQAGAQPVYVDSLEATWQVDPEDIRRKISPRTKAIMVVHLYGQACDMDAICEICREYNLLLIEDAAEAFGSLYKGRHVGTFGDAATFSFFGNKTITTGEGGMVVFRDKAVAERAYHLKNQGVSASKEYWHDTLAYNYRMTNIAAAIGLAQLEQAQEIIAKKRKIAAWYRDGLATLPLSTHDEQPDTTHSYWMCSIALHNASHRQELRSYLTGKGIETRPVFYPVHTLPHCERKGDFPQATKISSAGINLPSWPGLTRENVAHICSTIASFWS